MTRFVSAFEFFNACCIIRCSSLSNSSKSYLVVFTLRLFRPCIIHVNSAYNYRFIKVVNIGQNVTVIPLR